MITLVEEQIKRALHGWEPHDEIASVRSVEQPLRSCEYFFGAGNALLHRGMAADEGACHFVNAETAEDVEHECHLRLLGEARMAAGKHHAQQVIFDGILCEEFFD